VFTFGLLFDSDGEQGRSPCDSVCYAFFPVGVEVKLNEEVAKVSILNNTPVSKIKDILSVRWGVRVQFAPKQSTVWLPSKCYEFVSAIPGQKGRPG
jgi:hypothetical protein